jgi:hypothetical protein
MTEQAEAQPETTENNSGTLPEASLLDAVESSDIFAKGKPEGFPDDFWDAEKNAPLPSKLYEAYAHEKNRAEGLRKKLSKGEFEGTAPEDVKEYVVELDEKLKGVVPEGDPLFEAAREAAKAAGMPKDKFAKFMGPIIAKIAELSPKEPTAEEVAAYRSQELEKLGPSGLKIAANVKAFIGEMQAKGVLMEEDVKAAQGMITTAESLRVWNRIRSAMTNTHDVPVGNDLAMANATKAELEAKLVAASNARDEAAYNAIRAQLHKFAN